MTVPGNRVGLLKYGSFKFPDNYTHSIKCRPWYGANDLTPKGVECSLSVEFFIYSNAYREQSIDADVIRNSDLATAVNNMRKELLSPRKNLIMLGTGWARNPNPDNQDNVFPDVILGSQGGQVQPEDLGVFGTLNPKASIHGDINHGPLPQELTIDPIVGADAVKCSWSCLFYYSQCSSVDNPNLSGFFDHITELNYETTYTINQEGLMRYFIVGTYTLRNAIYEQLKATYINRRFMDTPEGPALPGGQKLILLEPKIPPGFRLIERTHNLGYTNNVINFRFELEEIAGMYPYFRRVYRIDAKHQIASDLFSTNAMDGAGFVSWMNRLDANITLYPGVAHQYAWEVFLTILMQRAVSIGPGPKNNLDPFIKDFPFPNPTGSVSPFKRRVIVKKLTLSEGLYSQNHSFSCEWATLTDLKGILTKSGFTRYIIPIKNGWLPEVRAAANENVVKEYQKETATVNKEYFLTRTSNKSMVSLTHPATDAKEIIFDPCPNAFNGINDSDNNVRDRVDVEASDKGVIYETYNDLFDFESGSSALLAEQTPETNENTYINYQVSFTVEENSRAYQIPINSGDAVNQGALLSRKRHTQQQAPINANDPFPGSMVPGFTSMGFSNLIEPIGPDGPSSVVVAGGENSYKIVMNGSATRVYFPITCPAVVSVEGFAAVRAPGYTFTQHRVNNSRVPIYKATWTVEYFVTGQLYNPHGLLVSDVPGSEGNTYTNANNAQYIT